MWFLAAFRQRPGPPHEIEFTFRMKDKSEEQHNPHFKNTQSAGQREGAREGRRKNRINKRSICAAWFLWTAV